jgi:hypothetical protein
VLLGASPSTSWILPAYKDVHEVHYEYISCTLVRCAIPLDTILHHTLSCDLYNIESKAAGYLRTSLWDDLPDDVVMYIGVRT